MSDGLLDAESLDQSMPLADMRPMDAGRLPLDGRVDATADATLDSMLDGRLLDSSPPDATPDLGVVLGACCTRDGRCQLAASDRCVAIEGQLSPNQTCEVVQCAMPTRAQLVEFALQLEARLRDRLGLYLDTVGHLGREFWNLNGVDPEYTGALLGRRGAELASDSRFVVENYRSQYGIVRHALTLERMAQNAELTAEERNATIGFAQTIQAVAILRITTLFGDNGVLPVEALDDPGNARFLGYNDGLAHVADLLDRAATALTNGGAAFPFGLSFGFQGFNSPATFRQFNRALAARVRLYQGDRAAALTAIASSFFNINGDLQHGPRYGFGPADRNPLFHAPDVDLYTVHTSLQRSFADFRMSRRIRAYDAERVARLPVSHDDLAGDHQLALVAFDTDPWPIIRNEELVLIYAETQIGSAVNEVLAAVNRVRNPAGLGNYVGPTDNASLVTEILAQRQRSFFGEGHRWIDMRRTNRLAGLPLDRPGDVVHSFLPRPDPAVIQGL